MLPGMTAKPPARPQSARLADVRARLAQDVDCWVATSSADGLPGLVPLSFDWDGSTILLATGRDTPAGANLRRTGRVRRALGEPRDVVLVDGTATELELSAVSEQRWAAYTQRCGWDPRGDGAGYAAYLVRPRRVQAWRESNELPGRTLMCSGVWVDEPTIVDA